MSAWNPTLYDTKHSFVAAHGESLVDLLAPQPGERILDIGCGTGHLTATLRDRGAVVQGLDASAAMIESARAAYPDIDFRQADASDFEVEEPFDAAFSNAALHWIRRAEEAAGCIGRALKPGGRFVLEMGGHGNVRAIDEAIQSVCGLTEGPWFFPGIAEYAGILERHGFEVRTAWLFDRPTPLEGPDGLRNWIAMFGSAIGSAITPEATEEIERRLRPQLWDGEQWIADYRRLRMIAVRV